MHVVDWGLIDFNEAWRRQKELADAIFRSEQPDTLVLCEHPDVITLGRNTKSDALVASADLLAEQNVKVIPINRGGEATVHNPGQLVGYPIVNLQQSKPDLHWFLRVIEEAIIKSLQEFGIPSFRIDKLTGVWVEPGDKICAIGIHCSRWITSHGFALNVNNDLSLFETIIPCGITDKGITSMARELAHPVSISDVKKSISNQFEQNYMHLR